MKYNRFGESIIARLEVGEEILASLAELAEREGVTLAEISGIGAVGELAVSVYDVRAKRYFDNTFAEPMEIVSLLGTVTEKDGKPSLHRGRQRRRRTPETRRRQRNLRARPAHRIRQNRAFLRSRNGA